MAADLEYFRRRRDTDPSYGVQDAIVEYLHGDFDEAKELANQICDLNYDPDGRLLTYDDVLDIIEYMKPVDAFFMARSSDNVVDFGYYTIDGYGHFKAVYEYWDYLDGIISEGWEYVVNGECDISDDLQSVIDLFEGDDGRSDNRRSAGTKRSGTAKRAAPKKKASKPKASAGRPKAGKSKTSSSNARPKAGTPGKAPAKRTTAKKPERATSRRY